MLLPETAFTSGRWQRYIGVVTLCILAELLSIGAGFAALTPWCFARALQGLPPF